MSSHKSQVRQYAPDVLVVAPCAADVHRATTETCQLASLPGWWSLPAVRTGRVYACSHELLSRPGPRCADSSCHRLINPVQWHRNLRDVIESVTWLSPQAGGWRRAPGTHLAPSGGQQIGARWLGAEARPLERATLSATSASVALPELCITRSSDAACFNEHSVAFCWFQRLSANRHVEAHTSRCQFIRVTICARR